MEFRQHAETIDADKIRLWARFCVHLKDYVMTALVNRLVAMCYEEARKQLEEGKYTFVDENCSRIGFW